MPKLDVAKYIGGREQVYVKHHLLERYLSHWAYKTGRKWDLLVFVDGFAGPWGTKDKEFTDASFGIGLRVLKEAIQGLRNVGNSHVRAACIFVEKNRAAFKRLDAFAHSESTLEVSATAFRGRFSQNIPAINKYIATIGANPFKFVFLDQKGWAATPMSELKPFVSMRSCELLFNLMTSFLTRFVDREDLSPTYDALFGRKGVIDRIRMLPKGSQEREEAAVEEYCRSLREVCGFLYVSRAVIMDPLKEKVRYYLIFATNSLHGIDVFKNAETEAAHIQDDVRYQTHLKTSNPLQPGLFVDQSPQSRLVIQLKTRYCKLAQESMKKLLLASKSPVGVVYDDLFAAALAFPLISQTDLDEWLASLYPAVKLQLSGPRRRKPRLFENDRVMVIGRGIVSGWSKLPLQV
jgi:three-Cys-motif partner protein